MWIGVIAVGIGGVVTAEVARRAASGRLGRNRVAGIRLPSTMRSDEAWAAAHAASAPTMIVTGWITLGLAAVAGVLAVAGRSEGVVAGVVLGACAVLLVGVLASSAIGVRAARAVSDGSPPGPGPLG